MALAYKYFKAFEMIAPFEVPLPWCSKRCNHSSRVGGLLDMASYGTRNIPFAVTVIVVSLLLSACATHSGFGKNLDGTLEPYGFLSGLWHGLIFPFVLLLEIIVFVLKVPLLIMDYSFGWGGGDTIYSIFDVPLIGEPNTGFLYYFGFLLGLSGEGAILSRKRR